MDLVVVEEVDSDIVVAVIRLAAVRIIRRENVAWRTLSAKKINGQDFDGSDTGEELPPPPGGNLHPCVAKGVAEVGVCKSLKTLKTKACP